MDRNNDPCKSIRIALIGSVIGLIATAAALVIAIVLPVQKPVMPYKTAKSYAGELINNGLYEQAVAEFDRILKDYNLSEKEAGAILYQIGDITAEHLHNPREALAAYLKLQELYPEHSLVEDAQRKIITQLDRTGQSRQAQRMLEKSVTLGKPVSEVESSEIVAKIGDRAITAGEISDVIAQLPDEIKKQLESQGAKAEFLRSYVGQQLIYDAALREGYDAKPEIQSQIENARKSVITRAYYEDKVASKIGLSASDVEMYYELHKADFGGQPLEEVRSEVRSAAEMEKMASLQSEMINELLKAEDVQLYPENLPIFE